MVRHHVHVPRPAPVTPPARAIIYGQQETVCMAGCCSEKCIESDILPRAFREYGNISTLAWASENRPGPVVTG
uniref:Uncharacterized protein n=1 Tax=Anopheles dirus TaxID=7168 RepID=A0A182NYK4_9DIPT